jgi:protein-tyrosine kinase
VRYKDDMPDRNEKDGRVTGDFDAQETAVDANPRQRALVRSSRSRLFDLTSSGGALPLGMLSNEQLDSFRELRTRLLLHADRLGLRHFTTLVVPMANGSGSSFVARNLAASFTLQEGTVAALVDCDFRHPTQHGVLMGRPDEEGLSEYLEWRFSDVERELFVRRLILPTAIPGLYLIPAGRCEAIIAGRPREYFTSSAMRLFMTDLRAEPCYIVLDGPSIVGSPDARLLSDFADLIILVVGYGRTTAASIAKATALFEPKKLAGIVFNEVLPRPTRRR